MDEKVKEILLIIKKYATELVIDETESDAITDEIKEILQEIKDDAYDDGYSDGSDSI